MTRDVEVIDVPLVRALIAGQFPNWADLPLTKVEPGGWDNRTFRLGDDLSVRLPSAPAYAPQVEKEQAWLPVLAPHLPLPIPRPVALGQASDLFPHPWSVNLWLPGEPLDQAALDDWTGFARDLGAFLAALQAAPAHGGPAPGGHSFGRGGPLLHYDHEVRDAAAALRGRIDVDRALALWREALDASWSGEAVWVHGDMAPETCWLGTDACPRSSTSAAARWATRRATSSSPGPSWTRPRGRSSATHWTWTPGHGFEPGAGRCGRP